VAVFFSEEMWKGAKNGNIENNLLATRKKKRCAFSCRCRFNGKTPTKMNWFLSWKSEKKVTQKEPRVGDGNTNLLIGI
jgi:hypothetical protein